MRRAVVARPSVGVGSKFPSRRPPSSSSVRPPPRGTNSSLSSSPSASTSASASDVRHYSVLYYKRKKKVHKQKGVSMVDGVLTVSAPPSCLVTLMDADEEDDRDDYEESDEDDGEGGAGPGWRGGKKKGGKAQKKKAGLKSQSKKSRLVSSGINWGVAKRAFSVKCNDDTGAALSSSVGGNEFDLGENGLHEDDVVAVSQFECQIVSALFSAGKSQAGVFVNPVNPAFMGSDKSGLGPTNAIPGSGGRRAPIGVRPRAVPLRSKSIPRIGVGVVSHVGKGPPRPPPPTGLRRVPPPQPQRAPLLDSGDDDGEDDDPPPSCIRTNLLRPSLLSGKKRRRVVMRGLAKAPASSPLSTDVVGAFSGAIGTPPVVPPSVIRKLKPHQRTGISFLWNCLTGSCPRLRDAAAGVESSGSIDGAEQGGGRDARPVPRGAILADEMGLGKTLMTVATIFALHRRQRDHRFIVVCPSSLVSNWANEFDKWIGRASQPKRVVVRGGREDSHRAIKSFVPAKPNQSEVLIISYDLFRINASILSRSANIELLVIDEGHRLKNTSGSQTLRALNSLQSCRARLLITGTPIQNNLAEFYNVANFVCPGLLGDLGSFRSAYERPIAAANTRSATAGQRARGQAASRSLDAVTSTFLLRRLQRDVLKNSLPPRSEFLVFCRPSGRQRESYLRMTEGAASSAGGGGGAADALQLLTAVRKLCSHPYLLNNSDGNERSGNSDDEGGDDNAVSLSGKLEALDALLCAVRREAPGDKVVIVSNFTSALTTIEKSIVRMRQWGCLRLDGSTEQGKRQALVDSFNRGSQESSFVFLLSSKAGGCGLNLIGANRLVMFDPDWNPATDMQAMARVYRHGQTKPTFIYRLFTSGTVEEVIYQRQTQKCNLATLTVDGGRTGGGGGFSREELRDCFTLKDVACDTKLKIGAGWANFDGADSLRLGGCADAPLLNIVEERADLVRFVHIVGEDERVDLANDISSNGNSDADSSETHQSGRKRNKREEFSDEQEFLEEEECSSEEAEFSDHEECSSEDVDFVLEEDD